MAKYEVKDGVGIIPDGTTVIVKQAFFKCEELTAVMILESVAEIGDYAFYGCKNLKEITIPNNVTKIGYDAFYQKADYYKQRLPKKLHAFVVEVAPEKKAKK